jgi:excisionase family DNA binding protein
MNPPLTVTMSEAAELVGVSRWSIQRFIREGLPFIPCGRKAKRINVSTLTAWLKAQERTAK